MELLSSSSTAAAADHHLLLCKNPRDLHQLHAVSLKSGLLHLPPVSARLLALYSTPRLATLSDALAFLSSLPSPPASYSFNALLARRVADHHSHLALHLFRAMLALSGSSHIDNFTFPVVLKGCAQLSAGEEGAQIHALVLKLGFGLDRFVQCSLVSFYAKCGHMGSASQVFDRMPEKDIVTWNSVVNGYVKSGQVELARCLFDEMPDKDLFTWTSLINGYSECGQVGIARELFDSVPEKSVVSWNAMIGGYMKNGEPERARELFDLMPEKSVPSWNSMITGYEKLGQFKKALGVYDAMIMESVSPNIVTLVSTLSAVSGLALLGKGRAIHEHITQHEFSLNGTLGICLIEMYSKCGSVEDALGVFKTTPRKKPGHYTAMIMGFGMHGMANSAIEIFGKMEKVGMRPNAITFIGLLNAFSHAGMVDHGRRYFELMSKVYQIEPTVEHYGCFVDLLCRVGHLDEAIEVINQMPLKPNKVIWMSLLNGCRKYKNIAIGELAAKNIRELDPGATGCYVLLSNIYAAAGLWENVSKLREDMRKLGVRKDPGCSVLEYGGKVHEFVVGDRSHPQIGEICSKLNEMDAKLRCAGYIPDTTQVVLCVDEKEKEAELSHHSERLAIAFGLINVERGKPIRIVKNLRVCSDCHNVTKLLSVVYGREFIVRDNSRFHHFRNGSCSCLDFW